MIYIKNSTEIQKIYIPKNDGMPCTSSHKGSGYDEGYHDGYVDGVGEGEQAIIATFTSATITENGEYGSSASPYSSVTVSIDTASTYNEGYESGVTDGEQNIINTFTSDTLTVNGTYGSSAHPYSSVTVDVDLDAPYESGYTDGYASGWSSGYSSGYSSGETTGYDEGYDSGYTSGMSSGYSKGWSEGFPEGQQDIINTFTSETLTVNGTYGSSAHPYSSVTVDVDMDAPYESGYTDGYESGYTSGYSSGYTSGETAGYDSGYSEGYESGYSSGSDVGYQEGYESGYTSGETAGYESGFTSGVTVGFNSGYTSGVTDGEQNIIDTFTAMTANTNGVYGSSAQPLSSITVDVPTGKTSVLTAGTFTENGTYEPSVVTLLDYIETDGYDILFDTGVKMTSTGETVVLDFMPLTGTIHYDAYLCYMAQQQNDSSDTWQLGFRQATAFANNPSGGYWYTNGGVTNMSVYGQISADTRAYLEISNTGITINGVSSAFSITTVVNTDCNIVLNGQYASNENYRCPYARYYGFKLLSGATLEADLRPALDGDIPCFYDMVNERFIYQIGTGHTTAGNVIGTSAITNFDGWSSVTVNVPTGETYNIQDERLFTATTNGNYTIVPSTATTVVNERYDNDDERYYITATTSNYPSTGYFELLKVEDEFDDSKGYIEIYLYDGRIDYDASSWHGGEVYEWGTVTTRNEIELYIKNANRDFTWTRLGDYSMVYDLMSSVTLTVDVDTASTYNDGYVSGMTDGYQSGMADGEQNIIGTFTADTATTNGVYGSSAHPLSSITVSIPVHSSTTEYDYNTIYAKYNFASSGSKPILSHTYYVQEMYVDGSSASEVPSTTRNFSAGEHSIAFVGKDPNQLSKYCFYMSGTELTELVVGKAFTMLSDYYGGALTNCTKLSAMTLLYDGVVSISSGQAATFANNGVMYVPASQMTAYVQSQNWSYLFTNKGWTIEMIEDTQVAYNEGFDDGLGVGYESGASSVNLGQKTITANGTYRASDDGYDGYDMIEVNVPSSGGGVSYADGAIFAKNLLWTTDIQLQENYIMSATHVTMKSVVGKPDDQGGYLFSATTELVSEYGLTTNHYGLHLENGSAYVTPDLVELDNATLGMYSGGTFVNDVQVGYDSSMINAISYLRLFNFAEVEDTDTGEIGMGIGTIYVWSGTPLDDSNLVARLVPQPDGSFYNTVTGARIQYETLEYAPNTVFTYVNYDCEGQYQSGYTSGYTDGYIDGSQVGNQALIDYIEGDLTHIDIPSGCTDIRGYAFSGMTSLSSVTIPDSVTHIGWYSFQNCTGLTNIVIGNSVTLIASYVFSGCTSLTDIAIPNSVTGLGSYAFNRCTNMTAATIGSGITTIPIRTFEGDTKLKQITFRNPTPPTSLGTSAFPSGTTYVTGGTMYVPSGSYQDYYDWTRNNTTAKRSFSGWTVTEYTLGQ